MVQNMASDPRFPELLPQSALDNKPTLILRPEAPVEEVAGERGFFRALSRVTRLAIFTAVCFGVFSVLI